MTLAELKESLLDLDSKVDTDFMIWLCPEDTFLADKYLEQLCARVCLSKNIISSLSDLDNSSFNLVFCTEVRLNILRTDVFDELAKDYYSYENTIIICKKIEKKILPACKKFIIEFPKLQEWQVKAYIKARCPKLSDTEIDWLYLACNKDIYKIDNECSKLELFAPEEQKSILIELKDNKGSDLYHAETYAISDAITDYNLIPILDYELHKNCFDLEPLVLTSLLLKKYRQILFSLYGSKPIDFEAAGLVSEKQCKAIENKYKGYPEKRILNIIDFLSGINSRLKKGELDISKEQFIDYIICGVLSK